MSGDEDELLFRRYRMLQEFVGWQDEDAASLRRWGPRIESVFPSIVDDFYDRIRSTPEAMNAIREGEPQIARLMSTLRLWLVELFSGTYDQAYVARRWRIGRRHVEIGLEPSLVSAAMSRLRARLVEALRQATDADPACDEREGERVLVALGRLLDLELAIVDQAFREEFTRRDQQTQRMATLGQVAGGIAHELRNPLNVIKTSVYFLTNASRISPEKMNEHLGRIERQVDLANEVISAVTQFARIAALERSPVDLAKLVPEWVDNHCLNHTIVRRLELARVPTIQADPRQLQIAVGNIVRNACEAMGVGGELSLTLGEIDRHIVLSIADQGSGIPPETLRRITEPWYSTKARGAGLGLAITKAILDKHGAELSVESRLGSGSCFTIRFPLAPHASGLEGTVGRASIDAAETSAPRTSGADS